MRKEPHPDAGPTSQALPPYSDWSWRADFGAPRGFRAEARDSQLAGEITLHHDCPLGEVLVRAGGAEACVEVFGFRGTFLGLALSPPEVTRDLKRRHVLRLDAGIVGAKGHVFARLNLRMGATTSTQVREVPCGGLDALRAEFDLAAMDWGATAATHAWIDLLFEAPRGARIHVSDLRLFRYPRADL